MAEYNMYSKNQENYYIKMLIFKQILLVNLMNSVKIAVEAVI